MPKTIETKAEAILVGVEIPTERTGTPSQTAALKCNLEATKIGENISDHAPIYSTGSSDRSEEGAALNHFIRQHLQIRPRQ